MRFFARVFVVPMLLVVGMNWGYSAGREPPVVDTLFVGHGAVEVAVNPLTDQAFVANRPSRLVTVIDMGRNRVIGAIPLFPLFAEDLEINCLTNRIYVSARMTFHYPGLGMAVIVDGDGVSVIDLIGIGVGRVEAAVDPFTHRVYAITSHMPGMVVFEEDTNDREWVSGPLCRSIGVDTIASHIYVSDHDDWVLAMDAEHQPCAEPVRVYDGRKLAVDSANNRVYLTQYSEDQLTIIDSATNESAAVSVGDQPLGLAVNPMTGRAYVANSRDDSVSVIDGDTVVATVEVGRIPTSIAVNPLTGLVYVVNTGDGTVSVIDDVDPAAPPRRILVDLISNLMVEAGSASQPLQEALAFVATESYDKAAHSLLAFSEEIEGRTLSPEHGERLALAAKKIIVMMIGN